MMLPIVVRVKVEFFALLPVPCPHVAIAAWHPILALPEPRLRPVLHPLHPQLAIAA
jgi:hypothetical protein